VLAKALDKNGVLCLDATNFVCFSIAGDGKLIDDMGTSEGSRKIQLYNGRAIIRVKINHGSSMVGVASKGLSTALLKLE
jgi:beta-galactosidase